MPDEKRRTLTAAEKTDLREKNKTAAFVSNHLWVMLITRLNMITFTATPTDTLRISPISRLCTPPVIRISEIATQKRVGKAQLSTAKSSELNVSWRASRTLRTF